MMSESALKYFRKYSVWGGIDDEGRQCGDRCQAEVG